MTAVVQAEAGLASPILWGGPEGGGGSCYLAQGQLRDLSHRLGTGTSSPSAGLWTELLWLPATSCHPLWPH